KVGSIDPVSDFQAMMASAIAGDEGGPGCEVNGLATTAYVHVSAPHPRSLCTPTCCCQELADLAVQQMQAVIHTLVRKGTTSSL
ncbi:unnamed protein product, partial [Ectocarpus sp. 13 AM-2016]